MLPEETREKLTWNKRTIWRELPAVLIAKTLQKQKSFICRTEYYRKMTNEDAKIFFEADLKTRHDSTLIGPSTLYIHQEYKDNNIEICIEWEAKHSRFGVFLAAPFSDKYYPSGHYSTARKASSTYLEGVIKRIKEAHTYAIIAIEEKIEAKNIQKQVKKTAIDYRESLSNKLGVNLTSTGTGQFIELHYGHGRDFGLSFERAECLADLNASNDEFVISNIKGIFSEKEIKQLIKIVGGCPRAIASRLTKK